MTIRDLLVMVSHAGHTTLVLDELAVHVILQDDYGFKDGIGTVIIEAPKEKS